MAVAAVLEKAKTTNKRKTKVIKTIKTATSRIPAKDQKKLDSYELVEINGATYSFEVKTTRFVEPTRQYKIYNFCPIGGGEYLKDTLNALASESKLGYANEIGRQDFELEINRKEYARKDTGYHNANIKVPKCEYSKAYTNTLAEVFKLDITTKAQAALKSSLIFNWCLENLTDVTYGDVQIQSKQFRDSTKIYNFVNVPIIGYNNIEVGIISFTVFEDLSLGNDRVSLSNQAAYHLLN